MSTDHDQNELHRLLARENIRDCIARLARAEDRRCDQRIGKCFWPEADTDFGIFSGDFKQYRDWVIPGSPAVLLTQHILGQTVIQVKENQAAAETHVISYHRIDAGDQERDLVIGGRYLDRLEMRDREWRILQRTMLYDWCQDWGQSADLKNGLMGTPFSGDNYVGSTLDDYSESFFREFLAEE